MIKNYSNKKLNSKKNQNNNPILTLSPVEGSSASLNLKLSNLKWKEDQFIINCLGPVIVSGTVEKAILRSLQHKCSFEQIPVEIFAYCWFDLKGQVQIENLMAGSKTPWPKINDQQYFLIQEIIEEALAEWSVTNDAQKLFDCNHNISQNNVNYTNLNNQQIQQENNCNLKNKNNLKNVKSINAEKKELNQQIKKLREQIASPENIDNFNQDCKSLLEKLNQLKTYKL